MIITFHPSCSHEIQLAEECHHRIALSYLHEKLGKVLRRPCASCTFPAQLHKQLKINGAGEGNRTLVSMHLF